MRKYKVKLHGSYEYAREVEAEGTREAEDIVVRDWEEAGAVGEIVLVKIERKPKGETMEKYEVTLNISYAFIREVEAESIDEAEEMVIQAWRDTNPDGQIDDIETSTNTKRVVKPRELKW